MDPVSALARLGGVVGHADLLALTSRKRLRAAVEQKRGDGENGVTGKVLTVLLCARDLPFSGALAVADSALRHGDVTHEELLSAAADWPPEVRRVVAYADARAANPFESTLRAHAIEAGLSVVPQWEITTGSACRGSGPPEVTPPSGMADAALG